MPWATMRTRPFPSSSSSMSCAVGSSDTFARTHASARLQTALGTVPPSKLTSTFPLSGPAIFWLKNAPCTRPFSPQISGNSASGVNRKSGSQYCCKYHSTSPIEVSSLVPMSARKVCLGAMPVRWASRCTNAAAYKDKTSGPLSSATPRPIR